MRRILNALLHKKEEDNEIYIRHQSGLAMECSALFTTNIRITEETESNLISFKKGEEIKPEELGKVSKLAERLLMIDEIESISINDFTIAVLTTSRCFTLPHGATSEQKDLWKNEKA